MADMLIDVQSVPATPAAGQAVVFVDTTAKILCTKDDAGLVSARSETSSIASQGAGFATDTYVTGSSLVIPSFSLQVRTAFFWQISASKTGAGTAQPIYVIRIGANQTTADAAILTLTGPLQTAIADIGTLCIMATVRSIGGAGVLQGTAWWVHRGTAANTTTSGTGFANDTTGHIEGTSAGFNTVTNGQFIGLSINGGGSAAWTITQVQLEAIW